MPGNRSWILQLENISYTNASQTIGVRLSSGRFRVENVLDENLLSDEECNEVYAPVAERYFASPF